MWESQIDYACSTSPHSAADALCQCINHLLVPTCTHSGYRHRHIKLEVDRREKFTLRCPFNQNATRTNLALRKRVETPSLAFRAVHPGTLVGLAAAVGFPPPSWRPPMVDGP